MLAAPPGEELAQAIQGCLREMGVAQSVVKAGGAVPADWRVDVRALDLAGDFTRPGEPAGVLVLQFRVLPPAGSGPPILDEIYTSRRRLTRRTASAVVAAWNDGLAEIVRSFATDLDRALGERRRQAARRRRGARALAENNQQRFI